MYKGKRGSRKRKAPPHRVDNSLPARMRKVGPDHFGLLLVDSGKKHYAARLTNFYGDNLWEPEPVPCRRDALATLIAETKKQMRAHGLVELVVGIERTGRWHQPAKQMLKTVWQVKMIHPFTTKQLRKPASPGIKTDKVDLTAMQRAMVCGYGVDEPELPAVWLELRELSRYRADLGARRASLKVQCKGRMEALIPGYTSVFEDFWKSAAPAALIEAYPSARRMLRAGTDRMRRKLAKAGVTCRRSTAKRAPVGRPGSPGRSSGRTERDHAPRQPHADPPAERLRRVLRDASDGAVGPHPSGAAAHDHGRERGLRRRVRHRDGTARELRQHAQCDRAGRDLPFPVPKRRDRPVRPHRPRRPERQAAPGHHARRPQSDHPQPALPRLEGASRPPPLGREESRGRSRQQVRPHRLLHVQAGRQGSAICKLLAFGRERKLADGKLYGLAAQALDQLPDNALPFERQALLEDGWNGRRNSPRPTAAPSRRAARRPVDVARIIQDIERRIATGRGEQLPAGN